MLKVDERAVKYKYDKLLKRGIDGFIIDKQGKEHLPSSGFAVCVKECDDIDVAINLMKSFDIDVYIGYWHDVTANCRHIGIVAIFESSLVAFTNAMIFKQKAMYNFSNDEVIDLRGFYT